MIRVHWEYGGKKGDTFHEDTTAAIRAANALIERLWNQAEKVDPGAADAVFLPAHVHLHNGWGDYDSPDLTLTITEDSK